jgi:hypothetical protein
MKSGALISTGILVAVMSILALCLPVPAFAVSTITASSAGNGVFLIQGTGIENAAGMDILLHYDTDTLANPRVVAGPLIAGFMVVINPDVPGRIHIVAVRTSPVSGSGVIATITFIRKGASPGSIISLVPKLADPLGSPIQSVSSIAAPPAAPVTAASSPKTDAPSAPTTPPSAASTGASAAPIVVPLPVPVVPGSPPANVPESPADSRSVEQDARPSVPAEAVPAQGDQLAMARSTDATQKGKDAAVAAKAVYQQTGILERFRTYRGERTPAALMALFNNESMIGARQEPPVVLSDGRSTVRFVFVSSPGARTSSDIAVMGAKLLSLKRDPDNTNTWIVELLPDRGAYQASVAVPLGELKMIYPITIAPKVDIRPGHGGTVTTADFDRYLRERGKDLNKDGKRDETDDFIFTANYLSALGSAAARH